MYMDRIVALVQDRGETILQRIENPCVVVDSATCALEGPAPATSDVFHVGRKGEKQLWKGPLEAGHALEPFEWRKKVFVLHRQKLNRPCVVVFYLHQRLRSQSRVFLVYCFWAQSLSYWADISAL